MRLYDLIQTSRGRVCIVMTDTLVKVKARQRMLRQSRRGSGVDFDIVESDGEKYAKKPDSHKRSGGCAQAGPRKVKWN